MTESISRMSEILSLYDRNATQSDNITCPILNIQLPEWQLFCSSNCFKNQQHEVVTRNTKCWVIVQVVSVIPKRSDSNRNGQKMTQNGYRVVINNCHDSAVIWNFFINWDGEKHVTQYLLNRKKSCELF